MAMTTEETAGTLRQAADPITLLRAALGGPRQVRDKLRRVARTLRLYADFTEIERRIAALESKGYVKQRPSRAQIVFGSLDMLRFVIVPSSKDYYAQRGISFGFHQVLRFLDDPVSIIDPTGLLSDRDTIMGHVMQVVHLNPVYDLQLLEMFPDGLERFEREVEAMVDGTHPRAETIGAIVEDPGYHARLLGYVRDFRESRSTPDLVRPSRLRDDPSYVAAEATFATLPGFIDYCCKLPADVSTLARRHRELEAFPIDMQIERREVLGAGEVTE